ncbi:hypothetical protein Pla144_49690 [Bythopirellula polymerisocia]|uniref:Uncharacterized protein n=1 Tax=Bythopirellula polymerisocia TaxID=2528003 RepID=A0A5C6C847_9BACT|nr:hypothetical protein Pla144_49690 [Bythopirellula polymerisocia]
MGRQVLPNPRRIHRLPRFRTAHLITEVLSSGPPLLMAALPKFRGLALRAETPHAVPRV